MKSANINEYNSITRGPSLRKLICPRLNVNPYSAERRDVSANAGTTVAGSVTRVSLAILTLSIWLLSVFVSAGKYYNNIIYL